MTAELFLLLLGAVLILAGVLAGSVAGRVVPRARVGRTPRIAAASAGLLCVVAALILLTSDDYSADAVTATVRAVLAPEEVSEEIRVYLGGRDVGVIRVDEQTPKARMTVTVPKTGRHAYRLESTRQVKGKQPHKVTHEDYVSIGANSTLGIYYSPKGDVFLLRER